MDANVDGAKVKAALEDAIAAFGSQRELARKIGVTQPAIAFALRNQRVTAEMAARIENATKGVIPKWRFRPDLWPVPKIGA
jgi:DNA-binding transcriptional regulator YdaS (Cro superfamily)